MDSKGEEAKDSFFCRYVPLYTRANIDKQIFRIDIVQWKEDRAIPRPELLSLAKGADGILCLLTDKIDAEVLDAAGTVREKACLCFRLLLQDTFREPWLLTQLVA